VDNSKLEDSVVVLREKERFLNSAQQIAKIGSWCNDLSAGTMTWSENFYRILGYDPHSLDIDVAVLMEAVVPDDRDKVQSIIEAYFKGEVLTEQVEYRIYGPDRAIRHLHARAELILDLDNTPVFLVGTVQDITQQVLADQERKGLDKQLRQAQRMDTIGTLAGGVAHDFNNILTPIIGYIDMAMEDTSLSESLHSDLEEISSGLSRAQSLTQQLLLFSKIAETNLVDVRMDEILGQVFRSLRPSLPRSIDLKERLDHSCGLILGDRIQLHQLLMNLCTNAIQAMAGCDGTLLVELRQGGFNAESENLLSNEEAADYICVSVSDTGPGMDEETLESIFKPFFSRRGVGKGTGLGLSVAHGIVKNHGGEIVVESEVGKGSSFHVYIPLSQIDSEKLKLREELPDAGKKISILVVDDEKPNLVVFRKMLTRLGYKVEIASDGEEALSILKLASEGYDLVITDMVMPEMTGLVLSEKIQQILPGLPIVIMTGFSSNLDSEARRRGNIRQVIRKPVKMVSLVPLITKAVS